MNTVRFRLAASVLFVARVAAAAGPQGFGSPEDVKNWHFHNGPEFPGATGAIRWDGDEGHDKPGCLVLEHSFVKGGNYVQATGAIPDGNAKAARVWLKKPAPHRVTFRVVDSAGQTFQKGVGYTFADWQQVEIDLGRWDSSYGGPGDNKVRPPLKQFGILMENNASEKEGALRIDDLVFLAEVDVSTSPVTYTALEAVPDRPGQWRGWSGEILRSHAPQQGFTNDFSLLGEPQLMRIHVESDGGGRALRVGLGSHFQFFHKRMVTLTEKRSRVVEVPLGRLAGWEHDSGENDGVARMPLRLRSISLEGEGGTLKVSKVEIVTLPRDGQQVVLVPDVREEFGTIRFSVKAMNLGPAAMQGKLLCDIRHLGGSLARHEVEMTLGDDRKPIGWQVSQPMGDHHFIEAVFQWSSPGFASKPVSIGTCRPPADRGSAELMPESFMGAGLYLYRYGGDMEYADQIARVCTWAQRAGVKWTREEIQWNATEPVEGDYRWQFYDTLVDTAHEHGISVYGLLCYWSPWSAKDTPQGVEQYCRWVRQVVRRYKDKIKHWEIWNEPNIFFWSGPRELYARMLTEAYTAIKEENADAVVMGCSTAGIDTDFIRKVIEWGGKFDALTIHPYRGEMNDLGFIRELQDVRRLVDDRDVWLTEIGFPSQLIDGWSERRQASLCARAYLCTAASGAGRNISWYDFRNDGNDPFYNEMNFGLMRNDLRPKPGYGTLATLGRTLGQMRVKEPIDIGAGAYAFRFTDGNRDMVAVCAPERGRLLSYRAGPGWTILDAFGAAVQPALDGPTATIRLDAGFPVYMAWPKDTSFDVVDAEVAVSADPLAARPGGSLLIRIQAARPIDVENWEVPQGWPAPAPRGTNTWQVVVPQDAPTYEWDVYAVIKRPGGTLRLPVHVTVAPALIRV